MTSEDKLTNGNDPIAVVSGELGDMIETWLTQCAAKEIQPRVTCKSDSVTLRAGARTFVVACTPESMKQALVAFKADARWQAPGNAHLGYNDATYRLSHPTDVPYVANGTTRGTRQTEGNTRSTSLGSVVKAQAALDKAQIAFDKANTALNDAHSKLVDAKTAETVRMLENEKVDAAKAAKQIEDAKVNRAALVAKAAKLAAQLAAMQELLDKSAV